MTWRDDMAEVLSTVDGVKGYAFRPKTPVAGDAWPLLSAYELEDGWLMLKQRILVFLPQDEKKASEWMDEHVGPLCVALRPMAYVERIDPTEGPATGQYSMTITLRSE